MWWPPYAQACTFVQGAAVDEVVSITASSILDDNAVWADSLARSHLFIRPEQAIEVELPSQGQFLAAAVRGALPSQAVRKQSMMEAFVTAGVCTASTVRYAFKKAEGKVPPRNGSCKFTTRNAHGPQFFTEAVTYYTLSYAIEIAKLV